MCYRTGQFYLSPTGFCGDEIMFANAKIRHAFNKIRHTDESLFEPFPPLAIAQRARWIAKRHIHFAIAGRPTVGDK